MVRKPKGTKMARKPRMAIKAKHWDIVNYLALLKKWERYRDRLKNGEKSAAAMHEYLRAFEFHKSIDIIERCINDLLTVVEKENFLATSITGPTTKPNRKDEDESLH
jgi:hypothetical protein